MVLGSVRVFVRALCALSAFVVLAGLAACASKQEKITCAQRDWYEVGRRDGAQGATLDRLLQYKRECGSQFQTGFETIYVNGRNAGLVEYCAPENAFELGRMGLSYMYVCPSTMEPQFLTAYRKGQQTRHLQLRKKDLDAQIETLTNQILQTHAGSFDNRKLQDELTDLKQQRAQNEQALDKTAR